MHNPTQAQIPDYGQLSSSFIQGPSFKPGELGTSPLGQGQIMTSTPHRGYVTQPAQQPLQPQQVLLQPVNGEYFVYSVPTWRNI